MDNSIDQQFVEFVVKSLVGKPAAVHIDRRIDEKGVLLELTVDPEDLGRVIGKRGATAQSLRTLLRALGTKNDARYNLKIIDNSPEGERHSHDDAPEAVVPAAKASKPVEAEPEAAEAMPGKEQSTDDILAEHRPEGSSYDETTDDEASVASDRLAKTRKELAEFDDLDV